VRPSTMSRTSREALYRAKRCTGALGIPVHQEITASQLIGAGHVAQRDAEREE
jgi:hypothetical protein